MGREALTHAEIGDEAGEVRALLERDELILRGDLRRRYPRTSLEQVAVEGDDLRFVSGGELVRLTLGERAAEVWQRAIATPPPTLRAKLGLADGGTAIVVGTVDDAALVEALAGTSADDQSSATMVVARIDGPADLAAARAVLADHPRLPLWAVYPKGRNVAFGDAAIRDTLRAAGFRDTKACAVSDRLTATRYHPG